jgi:trans-2,3-dihydro-3-hydroxyanthranilate isomerase
MMRRYVTVDVFTERQFGGNPLAVVLDAQGLSPQQMQAIAAEFNYAETTFVLPPADPRHTAHVRIFTPRSEVPFAGHPNVGTAYVLATRDPALAASGRLLFEEAAGLVPVSVLMKHGQVIGAEVTAPAPLTRHAIVGVDQVADCLSLSAADICGAQPRVLSVGLPFLVAEIASREALRRAKPNLAAHEALLPLDGADAIYFYTRDVARSEPVCDLMARMFAPLDGIPEDPATGSATAAVAALLAEDSARIDTEIRMRFLQGVDMGRPSVLLTRVVNRAGKVASVQVGGQCVPLMEGVLTLLEQAV